MSTRLRYTTADLEGLPDIDGVRYEIIDGELYVSKQPDWHHQLACTRIATELGQWSRQTSNGVTLFAPGLVLPEDENVAPDLVWVSRDRLAAIADAYGHLRAAPELIVEVLSPGSANERRDRELKLKLYSRQGVREYWIVDWRTRTVQVYRRQRTALRLIATLEGTDAITSPLLPGFSCPLSSLWEP